MARLCQEPYDLEFEDYADAIQFLDDESARDWILIDEHDFTIRSEITSPSCNLYETITDHQDIDGLRRLLTPDEGDDEDSDEASRVFTPEADDPFAEEQVDKGDPKLMPKDDDAKEHPSDANLAISAQHSEDRELTALPECEDMGNDQGVFKLILYMVIRACVRNEFIPTINILNSCLANVVSIGHEYRISYLESDDSDDSSNRSVEPSSDLEKEYDSIKGHFLSMLDSFQLENDILEDTVEQLTYDVSQIQTDLELEQLEQQLLAREVSLLRLDLEARRLILQCDDEQSKDEELEQEQADQENALVIDLLGIDLDDEWSGDESEDLEIYDVEDRDQEDNYEAGDYLALFVELEYDSGIDMME